MAGIMSRLGQLHFKSKVIRMNGVQGSEVHILSTRPIDSRLNEPCCGHVQVSVNTEICGDSIALWATTAFSGWRATFTVSRSIPTSTSSSGCTLGLSLLSGVVRREHKLRKLMLTGQVYGGSALEYLPTSCQASFKVGPN